MSEILEDDGVLARALADKPYRYPGEEPSTAIAREVADLEKLIAQARSYEPEQAIAVELAAAGLLPADTRFHIGVGPHVLNGLLIHADFHRLEDVKAPVAWLAQRLGKFTINDYAEMGRRTYDFGRLKFRELYT